jgi:hypothetical protein
VRPAAHLPPRAAARPPTRTPTPTPTPDRRCDRQRTYRRAPPPDFLRRGAYVPPPLADGGEAAATLQRCVSLRNELTHHMLRRHGPGAHAAGAATPAAPLSVAAAAAGAAGAAGGVQAMMAWAGEHGGGLVGARSQGSTSLTQFGFLVRLVLQALSPQ